MKIEFNDPHGYFGTDPEAVEKVVDAIRQITRASTVKSGKRTVKIAALRIDMGADKWTTRISVIDCRRRNIGHYYKGKFIDNFMDELELEIIYP